MKSLRKGGLKGKRVLLGVCGGISAYKAPFLVRLLKTAGADVTCVLTDSGARFVTPLTLQTLSENRVYDDMFDRSVWEIEHVALARGADVVVIVPATADAIARLAGGRAEDLLSCVVLATSAPVLVCPAMNEKMWSHPATQENVARLKKFGYHIQQPEKGRLACGEEGMGRLALLEEIISSIEKIVS